MAFLLIRCWNTQSKLVQPQIDYFKYFWNARDDSLITFISNAGGKVLSDEKGHMMTVVDSVLILELSEGPKKADPFYFGVEDGEFYVLDGGVLVGHE